MEKLFDVVPVEPKQQPLVVQEPQSPVESLELKQDLVDAYDQSKSNLQDLIDTGKDGLEEILQIAKAGQHPRAFEVYGTLLKNVVDANKELLNIQKTIRDMDGKKKESGDTKIDKAIFVGSTAELSKFLKGKEE